ADGALALQGLEQRDLAGPQGDLAAPQQAQAQLAGIAAHRAPAPGPGNGRNSSSRRGSRVSAPNSASTMARLVSRPKVMVGMKLDSTRMEKPATRVKPV